MKFLVEPRGDRRYRKQKKFWLNYNNPDERYIGDYLDVLKQYRKYQEFIRNALRLAIDLKNGGVGELLYQYPDIQARITMYQLGGGDNG